MEVVREAGWGCCACETRRHCGSRVSDILNFYPVSIAVNGFKCFDPKVQK